MENLCENEIVFVNTTLKTKWLGYQQSIIEHFFPNSKRIVVDGTKNWPRSWFYWVDEVTQLNHEAKYFIHLDEDFFITSKQEVINSIKLLKKNEIDFAGCSDCLFPYRHGNPIAFNSFYMVGYIEDLRKFESRLSTLDYWSIGTCSWMNSESITFKDCYIENPNKPDIKHECNYEKEYEPYYSFMWSMKKAGCKFYYLYPHFHDALKSTNPRISEEREDIGIHMWYLRDHDRDFDVLGLANHQRYELLEKYLFEAYPFLKG